MWKGDPVRLVGIRVSDLTDKSYEQISLFEEVGKSNKRDKIQKTLDKTAWKISKFESSINELPPS